MARLTLEKMTHMPMGDMVKLTSHQLLLLEQEADEQIRKARLAKDWLHGVLVRRYEDKARSERMYLGKDTGVVRLEDDGVTVVCDLPKKVEWSQPELTFVAHKLMVSGKRVEEYVDSVYRVSERKFNMWPSEVQALFDKARTVKWGKPIYKLLGGAS